METANIVLLCVQIALVSFFAALRWVERNEAKNAREQAKNTLDEARSISRTVVEAHNSLQALVARHTTEIQHIQTQMKHVSRATK